MSNKKCLEAQERAKRRIPGMTQLLSKRPDMFAPGVWPAYYQKAKGAEIWDLDGNHYIDMSISGIGANILGYADPDVNAAVCAAIEAGSSSSLNCYEEVELADLLCELHPWAEKVRFARSGGESVTVAIRIARAFTGRDRIAFCGYHGWHDWYLSANLGTENALGEHLLPGLSPAGVPKGLTGTAFPFRYNHIEELKKIVATHGPELAAIVMEPIRNDEPQPDFVKGVRELADEAGAVLVVDEISAGFRMNTGGAHLLYGISPDIAVFSKALGNGFPIAAIIGKGRIMAAAQDTFMSSTMWTERVGPAAALATINKHRKADAGKYLTQIGLQVRTGWEELARQNRLRIQTGGIPPCGHFSFDHPDALAIKSYFVQLMIEKGFLASTLFYAMLAHTPDHVKKYLSAVGQAFAEIADTLEAGDLKKRMQGLPASSGFARLT